MKIADNTVNPASHVAKTGVGDCRDNCAAV
jgi:hypothetical protein